MDITTITQMIRKKFLFLFLLIITSCTVSPGMNAPSISFNGGNEIYLEERNLVVPIVEVDSEILQGISDDFSYTVSPGDVLTFVVWGLPEVFPPVNVGGNITNPQNSRTINSDGTIFFPFIGTVKVEGLSVNQVREKIYGLLSDNFKDPQIDITVTKYNEKRRAYLLGEVLQPSSFYVGIEKISLTDAIGLAKGLDPRFSNAGQIYLIRSFENKPIIYKFDLSSPEKFLVANNFYIRSQDVIYVSASGITKWNRFFSQIFPFASFFNQLDNIKD